MGDTESKLQGNETEARLQVSETESRLRKAEWICGQFGLASVTGPMIF